MFSVEDLLVSHGYKVSKNSLSSYQGFQPDNTDSRTGNGTSNGYQSDPDILAPKPLAKGIIGDNEKSCVNTRRQALSTGFPRSHQCLEVCHASETGLAERPQIEKSHWTKTDKDVQYWRRRGQDFSVLLVQRDHGETGDKSISPSDSEGKKRSNIIDKKFKGQRDVVETMESVLGSTGYENWKPSGEKQWENVDKNVTKVQKPPEKKISDGSGEKLLKDFISYTAGNSAFVCPNKQKSSPLSISPESTSHASVSTGRDEHSVMKEDRTQPHKLIVNVESNKTAFTKPKYSRPLKPPSYEVHQQTWGAVEVSESLDNQEYRQKDEHHSSPRIQETSQESCVLDSGLEPPIYIPPPSYKSPPPQHASNQSFNKVPIVSDYGRQNNLMGKTSTSDKQNNIFPGNNIPYSKPANHRHPNDCTNSVQYIPFSDPRIKHIAVAQDREKQNHSKKHKEINDSNRVKYTSHGSSFHQVERVSAFSNAKSVQNKLGKRESIKHKQWLHISIPDQICCALHEHRDGSTASSLPENSETTHKLTLKKTQSDSACEIVTKVKAFEPESYVPGKKKSKRKLNETIFCLVSIPVKSDSAPSDICKNKSESTENMERVNMLKHRDGFFCEQRLLSASSSDLELQTLTGNPNTISELLNQDQSKTEENKQANDLTSIEQRKHRDLTYSGSWPGDQYKDQQTQTVFTDIQTPPFYNGSHANELQNKFAKSHCGFPSENERLNIFSLKGQKNLKPSTNSAFSRTNASKAEPRLELSNESIEVREKAEKNEMEAGNVCNKKEVFGQFLLKPVNRRPWDAISELESLNKEFQDQESGADDGEMNVAKEPMKAVKMEVCYTRTALRREMANNERHVREIQEGPMCGLPESNSKSEGWCSEKLVSDNKEIGVELQKSVKMIDGRSKVTSDRCVKTEMHTKIRRTGNVGVSAFSTPSTDLKEPSVQKHINKLHIDKIPNSNLMDDKSFYDHMCLDVVRINKVNKAKLDLIGEKAIRKLSQTDRSHGLSVPDLSKHFAGTNHNGELFAQHNDLEIPENESLHERAARILGIDVADDCLVSTESSETQSPENVIFSAGAQNEGKSRRKISVFSFSPKVSPETCSSVLQTTLDTETAMEKLKNIEQRQEQEQSLLCPLISHHGEANIARSAEKRVRNTSKMIESIQGKLASTPPRTAIDRLARMKEVDSVSRMRRLSIKSSESGDEIDEDKQQYRVHDLGARKFSTGSIFKRVISLDESLLMTSKGKEKLELSFTDAYDPTRVERV
ncbi:junctional cadherin 5-associated protein isoform 1-T2 [Discoglossus pictus]